MRYYTPNFARECARYMKSSIACVRLRSNGGFTAVGCGNFHWLRMNSGKWMKRAFVGSFVTLPIPWLLLLHLCFAILAVMDGPGVQGELGFDAPTSVQWRFTSRRKRATNSDKIYMGKNGSSHIDAHTEGTIVGEEMDRKSSKWSHWRAADRSSDLKVPRESSSTGSEQICYSVAISPVGPGCTRAYAR